MIGVGFAERRATCSSGRARRRLPRVRARPPDRSRAPAHAATGSAETLPSGLAASCMPATGSAADGAGTAHLAAAASPAPFSSCSQMRRRHGRARLGLADTPSPRRPFATSPGRSAPSQAEPSFRRRYRRFPFGDSRAPAASFAFAFGRFRLRLLRLLPSLRLALRLRLLRASLRPSRGGSGRRRRTTAGVRGDSRTAASSSQAMQEGSRTSREREFPLPARFHRSLARARRPLGTCDSRPARPPAPAAPASSAGRRRSRRGAPPVRSTRWQGTTIGIGLVPQAVPAARTARSLPALRAISV